MIQDLTWHVIGDQEEDFRRSKTILWSSSNLPSLVGFRIQRKFKEIELPWSKKPLKVFEKRKAIWKIFVQKITCAKNVILSITNEVLNVLIMCSWNRNQGKYVRYHEGCSYGAHNQGGNAYGRINHSGTNFTPRRQDGIGNFSPCARSFEHTSYKCYEGNRIEAENGIAYRTFERVPRKETRNERIM
ncbi:hypothetical protein M9H77_02116 [Catharanthus roseus]|uniref:Uncharacterized protein n=1 Tax=Catharanthus roseus TaxID=4058 RepID=A0ACC0C7M0_CATRO|nr:hypothetical protein M9H77_02116 [Catharanthus roseus]